VSFFQRLKQHIKASLLKTFLVTALFVFVYQIYNVEIIRSSIEDRAFDLVNVSYLNDMRGRVEAPVVNVLKIDRYALKEQKLLNKNGFINYGYIYPRDEVAALLQQIDNLPQEKQPKVVFLDLDMSFTSAPYGKRLSKEDLQLLEILREKREYVLLLAKTSDYNFIEHCNDKEIRKQITDGKIQFVSVSFTVNKDGLSRRYLPYQVFKGKKYWNAAITIWKLTRGYSNEVLERFKLQDIIDNRIIYKDKYNQGIDVKKDGHEIYRAKSYWNNLYFYSENYPFSSIAMSNSIVMIGIDHSESQDFFSVNAMYAKVSGIEMHTNALETIYKHDGPLKKIPLWVGVVIIFFVFLIVDLMLELVFERVGISSKEIIFISALLLSSLLFFGISVLLLKVFNLWFNWLIPFILFELYEVIEITLYYYKKYKERKRRI
jgi:CHASE2 domain-containing sensor protein